MAVLAVVVETAEQAAQAIRQMFRHLKETPGDQDSLAPLVAAAVHLLRAAMA
jgi:hypothetical protein